ncbi:MAG: AEC family transporter [Oscillospiraceae bacterium]|nr:AEC family transporter [Oscillospiraceae bacterium]
MLSIQLTLLLTIALGYGISKAGMMSLKTRSELTNITLNVILPCNIFAAFLGGMTGEMIRQSVIVLLCAAGLQLLAFILNKFLFIKAPEPKKLILKYSVITNNAGFMGLPILGAMFGDIGILYGSIFLIPMRIMMWTSGLSLFTSLDGKQKFKNLVTHPCMIAVFAGFAYVAVPFSLPEFLGTTVTWVGEVTRVMPMIIVGAILSEVKIKEVLDRDCFYFSFIRLLLMPAIMFAALWFLELDPLIIGVTVLMAAMPSAIVTAILAERYNQDSAFASKSIFVSTILSVAALPLIAMFLEWVF